MTGALMALATIILLILMSVRADRAFAHRETLPLSFGPSGAGVRAPRRMALGMAPFLALLILPALMLFAPQPAEPRVALVGIAFLAAHAWHIRMCRRTD